MSGNRNKLRLLYGALCAAQLIVMGMGLVVAHQIENSYSRNIESQKRVNSARRAINELEIYARSASPETLALDDNTSGPSQLARIAYSSGLFLRKAQALLDESEHLRDSPLVRSQPDLKMSISEMDMVAQQSRLAAEAWRQSDGALARARLTYADRSAERVQTLLGNINQDMARAKDDLLSEDSIEARRANLFLAPLSVLGILMVLPALLYARRLNENIFAYETQLEVERNQLEVKVEERTSALRSESEYRERMESFNGSRNRLLERVAGGKNLDDVLTQLVNATEQSINESRCLILLTGNHNCPAMTSNLSLDLAAQLETVLLRSWETISGGSAVGRCAMFIRDIDTSTKFAFAEAWSQGFQAIYAVPITDQRQQMLGVIALLLRDKREPDGLTREVLLSASRMISIALEHDRLQGELFRRAHYDPLTNLPNRILFEDRLQQAVALAGRQKHHVGVLCIDLDGFKHVNDVYGHDAGDILLQQVAQRLTSMLRKTDTMARLGGDEFAAVVHDTREGDGVARVSETLVRLLAEPYLLGSTTVRTSVSIGAALFPTDGTSSAELRRHADMAMYRAKERGRNTYEMFSAELGDRLARRKLIEGYLQEALDHDGFVLRYQPICAVSGGLVELEALIRFSNPELECISPSEFIPVAEQTGLIPQIGEWVLREACLQAKRWHENGLGLVPIAVNVSAIQLARPNFAEHVVQILSECDLSPKWLHIEVTETAIMGDFESGERELRSLAEQGVHVAIDDFGTGHSSLNYIHRLPLRTLKIDRSFVKDMIDSPESNAIVRAIVAMGKSLELNVIAEGVETEDQLTAVTAAGCDAAQGYFFSPPMDRPSAGALLRRAPSPTDRTTHSVDLSH